VALKFPKSKPEELHPLYVTGEAYSDPKLDELLERVGKMEAALVALVDHIKGQPPGVVPSGITGAMMELKKCGFGVVSAGTHMQYDTLPKVDLALELAETGTDAAKKINELVAAVHKPLGD
jgi:hypothetical protein